MDGLFINDIELHPKADGHLYLLYLYPILLFLLLNFKRNKGIQKVDGSFTNDTKLHPKVDGHLYLLYTNIYINMLKYYY